MVKNKKVYKIRLNTEDAKYGIQSKEDRQRYFEATGQPYSQLQIDAWKAAVESTALDIFRSLTPDMQADIIECRKTLPQTRPDACCDRCGGKGHRPDKDHWIPLNRGKVCFKCQGNGIEPSMDPVFFRRRLMDTLRQRTPTQIDTWATKVLASPSNPYYCVMVDIAKLWLADGGENIFGLPH